jgi:CBS domain-containing protein
MRIRDVMTSDLPAVSPGDTVGHAARRMWEAKVKALPVCEGSRLEGIITDWDVTCAVAAGEDPARRPVAECMSTELVAARPEALLDECAEMMADRRIHHLLVCDGDRFEGMVHLHVSWSQLGGMDTPIATFMAPI